MVPAASPTVPSPSSGPIAPVPSGLPAVPQVPVPTIPTSVPTDIPVLQSIPQPTQSASQSVVTSGQPNNSLMSPSGSGLLFDPSIIGSLPVVTPVPPIDQSAASAAVVPPGGAPTVQPTGLTRSDSLAAVIADLNQTLAQSSVSNGQF